MHTGYSVSRRDFLQQIIVGSMAGASILRMSAAYAQSTATATGTNAPLFRIQKVTDGGYCALARPQAFNNSNSVIFVNSKDVLVVDSQSKPSAAAELIAQIKREITPLPVRYLVNTHYHYDHTHGNPAYKAVDPKIEIIASEGTKQLMAQTASGSVKRNLEGIPGMVERMRARSANASSSPAEKELAEDLIRQLYAYQAEMQTYTPVLPDRGIQENYIIKDRAHDLHIELTGRGHTGSDVVVFCPQKRVVATGDLIISFTPQLDDSYPREWLSAVDSLLKRGPSIIVPGHGPVQFDHVRAIQFRNYMEELIAVVDAGKKAGKSADELAETITASSLKSLQADGYGEWVKDNLAHWATNWFPGPLYDYRLKANIRAVYNNLDRS